MDMTEMAMEAQVMSRLVSALEHLWDRITQVHPDVPPAVMVVAPGDGKKAGHYAKDAWQLGASRLPEVLFAGETFRAGAEEVLRTALHEGAHGMAVSREVKDTSRQGRYHNTKWTKLAAEMGLTVVDTKTVHGWTDSGLAEGALDLYAAEMTVLKDALEDFYRLPRCGKAEEEEEGKEKSTVSAVCSCLFTARGDKEAEGPRKIIVTRSVFELGGIACNLCGDLFTEVRV